MDAAVNYPLVVIPPPTPLSSLPCADCPLRREVLDLRQRTNFWESCFRRAKQREQTQQQEVERLKAELRALQQRFQGRKSQTPTTIVPPKPAADMSQPKRRRGQQPGQRGPLRRSHEHLPVVEEVIDLPPEQRLCRCCGKPLAAMDQTDDGEILEIEVRAYRRRYRRKRELRMHGLDLASATVIDGLRKLLPLFRPLYQALIDRHLAHDRWHADDTRWPIFERLPDQTNAYWTLSVYGCAQAIVFALDPTRCHDVAENYFGDRCGILNVDRASNFKAMRQVKEGTILLAYCWAHVRHDFLMIFVSYEPLETWASQWLERITELYDRNDARRAMFHDLAAFTAADQHLRQHLAAIVQQRDAELQQATLHPACRKALTSLVNHWSGLTLFVEHPHVAMDNNASERCHRGPVVGRKNFYGSGAIWSGQLATMLFSMFQTLALWGLCPRRWLTAYLTACAESKSQAPSNWATFLPWRMSQAQHDAHADPNAAPTQQAPNS
jgi:transposase